MPSHKLKIDEVYLNALLSGTKKSEIRYNDRDYQKDDVLEFNRYGISAETFYFRITHIHSGIGMDKNYVSLSVHQMFADPVEPPGGT